MIRKQTARDVASESARVRVRESLDLIKETRGYSETRAREFFAYKAVRVGSARGMRSFKPPKIKANLNSLQSVNRLLDGKMDKRGGERKGEVVFRQNVIVWVAELFEATCDEVPVALGIVEAVPAVGNQLSIPDVKEVFAKELVAGPSISDQIAAAYLKGNWEPIPGLVIQLQQKGI